MKMAKLESALRLVLDFKEAFNRHDLDGMLQLVSHDCVYEAPDGGVYKGKSVISGFWQAYLRQSPQAQLKVEEIFGLGTRCVMRWRMDGLSAAEGYARGVDIFQVRDGLIREQLSYVKAAK